eukprot:TRINITY_DN2644_c0_g1_i1.p1 TRINITY_DN2644_c0_g1~~TRINITY_DN2644_c0_g1_i1.p1  ORF type:complete len:422 (-),score=74.10 TRINITY_DN2644_c0_g1_i1:39-1304(-)
MSAYVIVLGDIGHSPRMSNHVFSLAEEGLSVTYVGYANSALPRALQNHPYIRVHSLLPYSSLKALPKPLNYILKALWVAFTLVWSLPFLWGPDFIIFQNPPSIPVLPLLVLYTCIHRKTRLICDWHNYGWSILAMSLGEVHPLVRFSKWTEKTFGSMATHSFCVSRAMKKDLETNYNVSSVQVLYDRPSSIFCPISVEERHDLFMRRPEFKESIGFNRTLFTEERPVPCLREDRPGLIVSSTSWTEDEDFGLLLNALQIYEDQNHSSVARPHLICVITGKGPQKEAYKAIIQKRAWNNVTVITPWLEPEDYPLMLASADLGVCLHVSSSGLDLPMKVVDMFGTGLPVAAVSYPTLHELVKHDVNGLVFHTSEELGRILLDWFEGFPSQTEKRYNDLSCNLEDYQRLRWGEYWKQTALPYFK